jgi:hypothetical protein
MVYPGGSWFELVVIECFGSLMLDFSTTGELFVSKDALDTELAGTRAHPWVG